MATSPAKRIEEMPSDQRANMPPGHGSGKLEELRGPVREAVRAVEPGAEIILYGSRARGDAGPESDWDLLILVDGPVDGDRKTAIRHRLYEVEWDSDEVLTSVIFNREDWNSPLSCANRLYYACFYAVSALPLRHDLKSTSIRAYVVSSIIILSKPAEFPKSWVGPTTTFSRFARKATMWISSTSTKVRFGPEFPRRRSSLRRSRFSQARPKVRTRTPTMVRKTSSPGFDRCHLRSRPRS